MSDICALMFYLFTTLCIALRYLDVWVCSVPSPTFSASWQAIFIQADEYARMSQKFFHLPTEEKEKYSRPDDVNDFCGWVGKARES